MGSASTYRTRSKVYDLLDVLYFNKQVTSPRQAMLDFMQEENIKVLDICTGTATNAICIAEKKEKSEIVGIDISDSMLRLANKKVLNMGINNIKLCKMDATKTEFKDNSFDVILISLVLHEINSGLAQQMILEAKRVLKTGGNIIIVEWEQPKKFIQRVKFFLIKHSEPKGFKEFLTLDLKKYFEQFGLYATDNRHCDYTRVIKLQK